MDFIQGEDLRERLERTGPVPVDEALPWFLEICDALAYLHTRNPSILHRDIKPGNLKIMPDGRAMLVDFGLAKVVDDSGTTTTGAKAMTPGFSPPEQYGTGRTDPRTDVYALSATLYSCLTATVPEDSLERAMGRDELTPLRERNPGISPSLARVIEKALEVRPEDRYQSVAEFGSALSSASRASRPTLVRSYPYLERTMVAPVRSYEGEMVSQRIQPQEKPRRWPIFLIGGLTVAMILIGAGIAIFQEIGPQLAALSSLLASATAPSNTELVVEPIGPDQTQPAEVEGTLASPTQDPALTPPAATENSAGSATGSPAAVPTAIGGGVGQLAFASDRVDNVPQIFLLNVDGTGIQQLTTLPDGACQPDFSPDGSRMVFISPCPDNQESYSNSGLLIIDLDTLEPQPLVTTLGGDYDPVWSPNGEQIAFTSERDGRPQMFVIDLSTTEITKISESSTLERQPSWDPLGEQLVYASTRTGESQIWLMSSPGGESTRYSFSDQRDSNPSWSHDGQLIVFQRRIGGIPRLEGTRFEDQGLRDFRICTQGQLSTQPMAEARWSIDDRWIVFETWPDGVNHNIGMVSANCTNFVNLTEDPAYDFDPTWRP